MRRGGLAAVLALLALLAFPAAAEACNGWSEPSMETQLMCPTCHQVLAYSQSSIATNIRAHLQTWCASGWTSGQVKNRLIAQFGVAILASPPKHGFDLLAWVIPGAALAAGVAVATVLALRWRGGGGPPSPPAVDAATSARIDADLASFE
ncbi:MAG TPA: cytochrome c-type biogenesis protein CcmH [Gaiellales bacterium]